MTTAERLAADAAEAAEIRKWQTHPDVAALLMERERTRIDRLIWVGIVGALLFTMTNVQRFAAAGSLAWSITWCAAWLVDPIVSVVLVGILIAERRCARWQRTMRTFTQVAKWILLLATYLMNTWSSYKTGIPSGIVLHSVPPLVVFIGAEVITDLHDKLTECVERAYDEAAKHRASMTRPTALTPASDPTPATQAGEPSAPPALAAPPTPEDPPVEGDTTQRPNAGDPPAWVATQAVNPPPTSGSPTQTAPTHPARPTPQPDEITDELLARARQFRATRAGQGLGHGGWRALVELGLTQRLAKELAHQLNTEPRLTVVGGTRGTQ